MPVIKARFMPQFHQFTSNPIPLIKGSFHGGNSSQISISMSFLFEECFYFSTSIRFLFVKIIPSGCCMIQFQSMQQDILFFLLEKQIDFLEREEQKKSSTNTFLSYAWKNWSTCNVTCSIELSFCPLSLFVISADKLWASPLYHHHLIVIVYRISFA